MPASVALLGNPTKWVNMAIAQLKSTEGAEDAVAEIKFALRKSRHLRPEDEDTYDVQVIQAFIDNFNALLADPGTGLCRDLVEAHRLWRGGAEELYGDVDQPEADRA